VIKALSYNLLKLSKPLLCSLLILSISKFALAQSDKEIIFDSRQSEVFGAKNLTALHSVLYHFQDKIIPDTLFRENKWWKKSGGFVYRMARLWLFDAQVDYLIALSQHEVFGHGARFREMGYNSNSFHLGLFFPYGSGHGFANHGGWTPGNIITLQESLTATFGGNEGNLVLANNLGNQMLLDRSIHYRQAVLYLISQNNLISYIWYSRLNTKYWNTSNNDIKNYISETKFIYGSRGKAYTIRSLSEQSLLTLANPLQLYAAYTILVKYGIQGKKKWDHIPMIPLGSVRYLPALGYDLTPFGSRYHFFNYVAYYNYKFSADISYADNRYFDYYGLSITAFDILYLSWFRMNATLEGWNQPELELNQNTPLKTNSKLGGLASVELFLHPLFLKNQLSVYLQIGYKTKGYSAGEPLDHSLILRYGLSFCFEPKLRFVRLN
jgi:hypothetical protein